MRNSVFHRLLTAALMAAAAFAQPGEALVHGMAHEREHHHARGGERRDDHRDEHRDDHHRESGHDAALQHPESLGWASTGHTHGHVHAAVDDASVRNRTDAAAISHDVELPEATLRDVAIESPSPRAPLARGDPATGPPPRLRAPPFR